MLNPTNVMELQKAGVVPVDVEYWLREFDEEHGAGYDDLAHFGLTDHDKLSVMLEEIDFEEHGNEWQ